MSSNRREFRRAPDNVLVEDHVTAAVLGAVAMVIERAINDRPSRGRPGSAWERDFKHEYLEDRSILSEALRGILGLSRLLEGSVIASSVILAQVPQSQRGTAAHTTLRGCLEYSLRITRLLGLPDQDAGRRSRMAGWIKSGLKGLPPSSDGSGDQVESLLREMVEELGATPKGPAPFTEETERLGRVSQSA